MGAREAFGPNLRRTRMLHGVSLTDLAQATKVAVDVWEALERNDFSQWPKGLYARAYIREYALAIGVDAEATVDEFCRWFAEGDRRAERIVRGQAEIVGHTLAWQDDLARSSDGDRRASPPAGPRGFFDTFDIAHLRVVAAAADALSVALVSAAVGVMLPVSFWMVLAVTALLYHAVSVSVVGSTPAVWAIDARRMAGKRRTRSLAKHQFQPDVKPSQIVLAERR